MKVATTSRRIGKAWFWSGAIILILALLGAWLIWSYMFNLFDNVEPLYNSGAISQEELIARTRPPEHLPGLMWTCLAVGACGVIALCIGLGQSIRTRRRP